MRDWRPTDDEAGTLLAAAHDAIDAAVRRRAPSPRAEESAAPLRAPAATFVTLRSPDGALRGCIGELVARRALIESVRDCAVGAALRDPRFEPVAADEVDGLHVGISVLTSPAPIAPADVEVGRHGLLIEHAGRRGVLLPEVATERGWDAQTFLAAVCQKAGLPLDAWREPGARLSAFETIKLADPHAVE